MGKKLINHFYRLAKEDLYKINRSITGAGTLKTLKILKKEIPEIKIKNFKSNSKVFDWKVPPEWNVRDAFVTDKYGKKIIDFKINNLHLMGYSKPFKGIINKNELLKKLYFSNKISSAIPYVTSYYKRRWGFCISKKQYRNIEKNYNSNDKFRITIDSNFKHNGKMHYGEIIIKGKSKQEILLSTYICHPSMANNELSGPIVMMALIKSFQKKKNNKTLRIIFIPETIGSISYISKNYLDLKNQVIGGYLLTTIGDERMHSCMLSRNASSISDKSLIEAYKNLNIKKYKIFNYSERGSDERQFNSPNINLGITSIFRSKYFEYPEYHTSHDDFNIVTERGLYGGFKVAKEAIEILLNKLIPKYKLICEPNLGKRGLYPSMNHQNVNKKFSRKILEFIEYSDGNNSIQDIEQKLKISKKLCLKIKNSLIKHNLISC